MVEQLNAIIAPTELVRKFPGKEFHMFTLINTRIITRFDTGHKIVDR